MASRNVNVTKSRREKCSFTGCSKSKDRHPDLHFFQFPTRRPSVCKEWIANCANSLLIDLSEKVLKFKVVCQEHFTDNSFRSSMKNRLEINAVPTICRNGKNQKQPQLSAGKMTTVF